ncbi:methyl-accepting chemotaxis protein [uncultured Thiodictyon sp.]|jgi:methyl-accepting chemotaxis protein|uniref:methyl-accepting chemotaxis protein n=1 Tax=uncultured Thiodictyon sp. TaxID=1846217 RepID=UPI0025DD3096|nr:methyl-accepting chemotaxis protein [uncultured Thiodictyon sp.]
MSADQKGDHARDPSQAQQSEHGGDFVVPEPDGVQSGMPFHGSDDADPGSRATAGRPSPGGLMKGSAGGGRAAVRGLSLKRKLNLALGLLTLVILVLGAVSVRTLHDLTTDGIPELGRHADLAQVSEEIKTAVYRTMLAQSDYLLLDDQSAQDQVLRLAARARERVEQLKPLVGQIASSAGTNVTAQHRALIAALDEFDARFNTQIKEVSALHKALAEQDAALQGSERQLAGHLDALIAGARDLTAAAWPEQGTASAGQAALGRTLDRLTRELLAERVQLEAFFASHNPALNDAARTSAAELAAQLEALRADVAAAGLASGLADLRKALGLYTAQLREIGTRLTQDTSTGTHTQAQIATRRQALVAAADRILTLAEELTTSAWRDIDVESTGLQDTGAQALWLVGGTALVGFAVGLLVLVTVPRPIVAAIETLMTGAHQIARGNLTYMVEVASRDELGALADSFNQMRENLLGLVQRIQRASVQLSSSINEIQAASTEQAASSSQQASAVNELSASLNEMSQSAATLVSSSETVGRNVGEIAGIVTDSNHKSTQMMSSMDAIGLSTRQTAERIKALNDKMDDINEAVATISMVADQTTLLSLNASIEANKAGEMGKGFSVVAQEIRRLSDRSIDSAGNISGMVRDIQRATESSALAMDKSSEEIHHGVALVGETSQALVAINAAMDRIQEQMTMILESVRAQADAARMVQTTSTEMLSSANMVAKAASQTRSVTYELNAMATQLASAVAVFRV